MSKKTPIKEFWAEYLTYDAQKSLMQHAQGNYKVLKNFVKKANNKFFVYHDEDANKVLFYDICTIPDNDIQIVKIVHNDKIKSTVVDTCSISVVEFKIRYKLTEAIYDKKCETVLIPATYSKDFTIDELANFKLFKTFREARDYYYDVCEQIDINKACERVVDKYDKKRNAV
jgi:predicted nucleic acid-binding Zn finger protein